MLRIQKTLLLFSLLATILVACHKDKTPEQEPEKKVGVNTNVMDVKHLKDTVSFKIYSHVPWQITNEAAWCRALTLSGDSITVVKVAIDYNPLMEQREGKIKVLFDVPEEQVEEVVLFKQAPEPPMLILTPDSLIVTAEGGNMQVVASSNIPFEIINIDDYPWIQQITTYAMSDETVTLSFEENTAVNYRMARLQFKQVDTTTISTLIVMQYGQGTLETDKKVLLGLYQSTQGDSWTNKWDVSQPIDTWHGVVIGDTPLGKRVTELRLSNNNLIGKLPDNITELDYLKSLWLDNNQLSGILPATLPRFSYMVYLYLHNNRLEGTLPENIGLMEFMDRLHLSGNLLEGTIPASIGDIKNLSILGLSDNNLSGSLPASIGKITTLKHLFVNGNRLTGTVPSTYKEHANWIDWQPNINITPQQNGIFLR